MGEVQRDAKFVQRSLNKSIEPLVKSVRDRKADQQIHRGVDKARTELREVLHQAHARQLCAVRNRSLYVIDDISHAKGPRWCRALQLVQRCDGSASAARRNDRWSWLLPASKHWERRPNWLQAGRSRAASGSVHRSWRSEAVRRQQRAPL